MRDCPGMQQAWLKDSIFCMSVWISACNHTQCLRNISRDDGVVGGVVALAAEVITRPRGESDCTLARTAALAPRVEGTAPALHPLKR